MNFEKTRTTPPIVHQSTRKMVQSVDKAKIQIHQWLRVQKANQPDGGVEPPTLRLRVSRSTD